MKVLRTALCLALILTISSAFPKPAARADTNGRQYARADTRNVYMCEKMDLTTALFAVPYTYCVEILVDHGEWYLVRYAQDDGFYETVTGYCRKDGLTYVDILPDNIYLNFPVTAVLRADVPQDDSMQGLEITVTAAYYGVYYKGAAAYSYVLYNGEFRYVPGSNDNYPLNEIPVQPAFTPEISQSQDNKSKLITSILITAVAASAIVILIFTGKYKGFKGK